ncbi:transposase [Azospirillum endophyticum]
MELLVNSTGVKLCGPGEWLVEKHGARRRRAWKKLHVGLDAVTGRILAATLTDHGVNDGSQVGALLDQVEEPLAAFVADGDYDQTGAAAAVAEHMLGAAVVVPPRSTGAPSANAVTDPTQHDQHLQYIAQHGRLAWQKTFRCTVRALVEAFFSRGKRAIGDGLRFQTGDRRNAEIVIAVRILNRMRDLGHPDSIRVA